MNKFIIVSSFIALISIAGCADDKVGPTEEAAEVTQGGDVFENDFFSLHLPGSYIGDGNVIRFEGGEDFPSIVFSVMKTDIGDEEIPEVVEELTKDVCDKTGACGEILDNEMVTIDEKSGMKFTEQIQGRPIENSNGASYEYYYMCNYATLNGGRFFQFWTSATVLEDPKEVCTTFDGIMETLSFK